MRLRFRPQHQPTRTKRITMFSRLRLILSTRIGIAQTLETPNGSPFVQLVRWRKRRWAPKAPSKQYYVRQKPEPDMNEILELRTRYNHYRTTMKALSKYIRTEVKRKTEAITSTSLIEEEEREFIELLNINNDWNAETAKVREARQAAEDRAAEEKRINDILAIEQQREERAKRAEELVRAEKARSKDFISAETLESEIEKALNLRVSYNFAIDIEGNRYVETSGGSTVVETGGTDKPRHFNLQEPNTEEKAQVQQS